MNGTDVLQPSRSLLRRVTLFLVCSSAQDGFSVLPDLGSESPMSISAGRVLQKRQPLWLISQTQASSKPEAHDTPFGLVSWCPQRLVTRAPHVSLSTPQTFEVCGPSQSPAARGPSSLVDPKPTQERLGGYSLHHSLDYRSLATGLVTSVSGAGGGKAGSREAGELFSSCPASLKHQLLLCLI